MINLECLFSGFPKDPKSMSKFELSGFDSMLSTKGNYKAAGKVLLFPLSGDGYAELQFCKYNRIPVRKFVECIPM